MPDITMCKGDGCKQASSCYRAVAKESMWQMWYWESPLEEDGTCKSYWDVYE